MVSTVKQDALASMPLHWVQPLDADGRGVGKALIAVDRVGVGPGEVVVFVTSREAAMTLPDPFVAVDAAVVAKVDWCDVGGETTLRAE